MIKGATRKHLKTLRHEMVEGLRFRVYLFGAASLVIWLAMRLLEVETHNAPVALRGVLTASVLLLISLAWVFVTLWFSIKVHLMLAMTRENVEWLRKFFKSKVFVDK